MSRPVTLGRPAKGLPRYYLDCGWHRHPRFAGLSLEALFCWQASVGYCTQHATDGTMPADVEELSLALGVRVSAVRKAKRELLDRGLWISTGPGLGVQGYVDHNPLAAEVTEHAERQRSRGALGNHTRWHERRGVIDPDCPYCESPGESPGDDRQGRSPEGSPPGDRQGNGSPGESLGMGWDGNDVLTSSSELTSVANRPDEEEEPPDLASDQHIRVEAALGILAETDLDRRQQDPLREPIYNTGSWLAEAINRRRDRHAQRLAQLAELDADATPAQLAEAIHHETTPDPGSAPAEPPPHVLDGQQAAMMATAEAGTAHVRAIHTEPRDDTQGLAHVANLRDHLHDPGAAP